MEYTDPSGVFPFIESRFRASLPLRNLNWQSPTRPTRSIETLYIDLVPDEQIEPPPPERTVASPGVLSDRLSSAREPRPLSSGQAAKRERRHQIPGLRQTPYLKIYVLRCDDSEVYKSSARRLLREWIKNNAPQSQKKVSANNQENHDAFEWMIVHVVIPDGQNDFTWPSKSSVSVLEKIKADFNISSKPSVDRVAQVLSGGWHGGQHRAPDVTSPQGRPEPFRQESIRAWEDLVSKLKLLILSSFDLRVSQYEEDIKQRISQRSLPGWNFCTFFVLKEGLASGFESAGLLEDALLGYDELSVELISALRDEDSKKANGEDADLLRDYTKELMEYAQWALKASKLAEKSSEGGPSITRLLDMDTSSFRERILANDVSAFEFRSYVFARQVRILLRMASLFLDSDDGSPNPNATLNPMVLAEICGRAVTFIASVSRTIRRDLQSSVKSDGDDGRSEVIIENIVASWATASAQQVLDKTGIFGDTAPDGLLMPNGARPGSKQLSNTENLVSLVAKAPSAREQRRLISRALSEDAPDSDFVNREAIAVLNRDAKLSNGSYAPLLAQRAQLSLMIRTALSNVGRRLGFPTGWSIRGEHLGSLEDISLRDAPESTSGKPFKEPLHPRLQLSGIHHLFLDETMKSQDAFYNAYEV